MVAVEWCSLHSSTGVTPGEIDCGERERVHQHYYVYYFPLKQSQVSVIAVCSFLATEEKVAACLPFVLPIVLPIVAILVEQLINSASISPCSSFTP